MGEEKVNEFLREHLYGGKYGLVKTRYSLDGSKVVQYDTVTEKIRQSAGEDMILHMDDGSEVVIDEKSALYYPTPRKKINTFAFELKTEINAHEDNQGWLFGKNYKNTDYYLINWITLPDNVEDKFWWQKDIEIVSVESMLLNKKRIQDFVRDVFSCEDDLFGKYDDPDYLEEFMNTIDGSSYSFKEFYKGKGIRLMQNLKLPEQPINIVIDKEYLKKIAELHIESYFNKAPKKIIE
ncbi:hypothetical protein [Ligilactobacillus murinus]|uniref:hypothetical protein n=1 Tax=Ligilactobacillus murinus TaxID=1622 RepID=UPI0013B6EF02|nr:hypothetical protein [Ligilactobacillus murinus]NEF96643.1 hypothetical protein [Ligilactobacillus murinus]NEG10354.1 hypothetical protein [Ligilactobacillus murinus]NEG12598.1 hypothetical protein [Ligilactobacillus murinus]NEG28408.1 hypothetical protein [Ligilactobacillus murinus]